MRGDKCKATSAWQKKNYYFCYSNAYIISYRSFLAILRPHLSTSIPYDILAFCYIKINVCNSFYPYQKSSEQHSGMFNCLESLQGYKEWWQSAFLKSRRELKQEVGYHIYLLDLISSHLCACIWTVYKLP